jgi:hypothetical protein
MELDGQADLTNGIPLNNTPLNALVMDEGELLNVNPNKRQDNGDNLNAALFKKQAIEESSHELNRKKHEAVRNNPEAIPADRATAQLGLACMDIDGQATADGKPNFPSARQGFEALLKDPNATDKQRAATHEELKKIAQLEQEAKERLNLPLAQSNQAMTMVNRQMSLQNNTHPMPLSAGFSPLQPGSPSSLPPSQPAAQPHANHNPYGQDNGQYQNNAHLPYYSAPYYREYQNQLNMNHLLMSEIQRKDLTIQELTSQLQKYTNGWALIEKVLKDNK